MNRRGWWAVAGRVCGILLAGAAAAHAGDVEHRVKGVVPFPEHERSRANAGDPDVQRQRAPRPAWVDDLYWDELVFDAFELSEFDGRRTHGLNDAQLADLDIYIRTTAPEEGVDPISEDMLAWWREAIPEAVRQFTGQPWRGRITSGTDSRELDDGLINVGIGTAEDFEERSACAFARTWSYNFPDGTFAWWAQTEILFNPDEGTCGFRTDTQGRIMAHELGHALGLYHVRDTLAIMYATAFPDQRYTQDLVDHAQLLYEIGPGLPYPGFGPAIPDTTRDQWTGSVDQVAYDASLGVVTGRAWHDGAGRDVIAERLRIAGFFLDAAGDVIGDGSVRSHHFERTGANTKWEFELPERDGWESVALVSVVFLSHTGEDGLAVDCTDAEGRGRSGRSSDGIGLCVYERSDIEVAGAGWTPGTVTQDLADRALEDLRSQDGEDGSSEEDATGVPGIEVMATESEDAESEPVPALPLGGLGVLAGWLLLMGCRRRTQAFTRRNRQVAG